MKTFQLPEGRPIELDWERPGMPFTATILHPQIWQQQEQFVCIWGSEENQLIKGYGESPEAAAQDWDKALTERIRLASPNDDTLQPVREALKRAAEENQHLQDPVPDRRETPPATVWQDVPDKEAKGIPTNTSGARKFSADESNTNGSEFR